MSTPQISEFELSDGQLGTILQDHHYRSQLLTLADLMIENDCSSVSSKLDLADGDEVRANIADRLASSKRAASTIRSSRKVGVIFGMWKERARIQPMSLENPNGENFLVDKLLSLSWLFEESNVSWHLYAVDDGCPQGSAKLAREIASKSEWADHVSVLELKDNAPGDELPLGNLASADESIKGGAIILGCVSALEDGCDLVCYTDADNSTHLAQLGNLIAPIEMGDAEVAVGCRWKDNPYSWWHSSRGTEQSGSRIFRHLRGLLDLDLPIEDVFCPLKAFRRDTLMQILPSITRFDFGFDLDIAAKVADLDAPSISPGILYFDSVSETTWVNFGDASVWFQKLDSMARNARRFNLPHDREISSAIRTYLQSPEDVEFLFGVEPPLPLSASNLDQLGKQETMTSAEVIAFLETSFSNRGNR